MVHVLYFYLLYVLVLNVSMLLLTHVYNYCYSNTAYCMYVLFIYSLIGKYLAGSELLLPLNVVL